MPLQSTYENQNCSVAATLELIGERWTLLIVREALLGVHRFDEIQADLGIARNVLQTRLQRLVDHGIMEKRLYQEHPERYEYRLTAAGLGLWPTIVTLMKWGDANLPQPGGPPVVLEHRGCGGAIDMHATCERCGEKLSAREAWATPGPGAGPDHPLRRRSDGRTRTATA
ncbi:MAG: helix-turn-helix domain-containing protein [Solirubrobacteraceae bacterium]|jgi:DNA-binding HxlR family transcriptional regulator